MSPDEGRKVQPSFNRSCPRIIKKLNHMINMYQALQQCNAYESQGCEVREEQRQAEG